MGWLIYETDRFPELVYHDDKDRVADCQARQFRLVGAYDDDRTMKKALHEATERALKRLMNERSGRGV
jgi:hypothetical protein